MLYSVPASKYRYQWRQGMSFEQKLSVGAFKVRTSLCSKSYRCQYGSSDHQCLCLEFIFERKFTTALISIYFPSTLMVLIAFVSFWLEPVSASPGRITLVVTSLLALVTQLLSVRTRMVQVSYVTALDIWFFACLTMVSLCLFEFSLAYSAAIKVSIDRYDGFICKNIYGRKRS